MPAISWRPQLLGAGFVAFLAIYAALLPFPATHEFLGGLAYHIPPLVAIGLTPRVLRRTTGAERAGWTCVLALLVTWDAAEWVYSYYSLIIRAEAPIPSLADPFYYAGYLAFSCALPLLARSGRGLHNERALVDAAIVVVVAGALFWWFVISPGLPDSGASTGDFVLVGYPLLDLGLFATLVVTFYGGWRNYHSHVRWLLAAVAVLIVSDVAYSLLGDAATVDYASPLDLGWLAGYCGIAMALAARGKQPQRLPQLRTRRQSTLSLFLPYAAMIPLFVAMAFTGSWGQRATVLTGGAVVAAALIMIRQWLTLFDNQRLYASLEEEAAELERLRGVAAYQAEHDELTGLLNRRAWFAAAESPRVRTIALLDIDNFKHVNDRFGHPAGDVVLRSVSKRLRDLLPEGVVLGRVGGEEFAAAFPEVEAAALVHCRAVLRGIARYPIQLPNDSVTVTLSAGVSGWPVGLPRDGGLRATYERADAALYEAKRAGRNRVVSPRLVA
jgi:diguanylate cyclase (GGDEF)-like protein